MKAKEIEKLLIKGGWQVKNQTGSHKHFIHPIKPGKVTIPMHKGDVPVGTAKAILKQAGLK